jgi:hypothetical protein
MTNDRWKMENGNSGLIPDTLGTPNFNLLTSFPRPYRAPIALIRVVQLLR